MKVLFCTTTLGAATWKEKQLATRCQSIRTNCEGKPQCIVYYDRSVEPVIEIGIIGNYVP